MEVFAEDYSRAFRDYLATRDERSLGVAYELGRMAVARELSLMDLAEAHHRAALEAAPEARDPRDFADAAAAFFRESLATFEIAARSFREAHETVRLQEAHAARQRALAEAAVDINGSLEPERILELTAQRAVGLLGAHGARATARLARETPELVGSAGELDGSRMTVPLCGRGERELGSLVVSRPEIEDDASRSVLLQLARMAAAAIENAERYQRERHVATTLQRGLLPPRMPDVPGLEIAASYRATGDGIQVGGDFYDMFRAGSGDWVVVIGDVCGKGPAAASLTALTRYTVRAAAMHETRPSRVLSILNDAMIEQRDDGRFATVLCAYLTPLTRSVAITCACGGHPLPLVRRADGRVETLGATGTLLGVVPEPALPDSQGELLPGDLLLLYTDGVIEVRRGRKEIFGAEDLVALLERHPDLGPQDLLDRIADEVLEVSGGVLRDDVALLALQARK